MKKYKKKKNNIKRHGCLDAELLTAKMDFEEQNKIKRPNMWEHASIIYPISTIGRDIFKQDLINRYKTVTLEYARLNK